MGNRALAAAVGLAGMLAMGEAGANDAVASIGAGGLELLSTEEIAMVSEDLYISLEEIRVRYAFRNLTDRDIETTVAFPLPPIDMLEAYVMEAAIARTDGYDFVGFQLWVEGEALEPELFTRATVDGRDVTPLLDRYGIPYSRYHVDFYDRWRALDAKAVAVLRQAGVAESYAGAQFWEPLWRFEAAYHWQQRFPADATVVVEHAYRPVVGGTFVIHHRDRAEELWFPGNYCVDAATEAGIRRRLAQMPTDGEGYAAANLSWVDYILTTANGWAGPIGHFRLTVDKGRPENIVSWCGTGVRRTSPTTFVIERENFEPSEDLHIMVMDFPGL